LITFFVFICGGILILKNFFKQIADLFIFSIAFFIKGMNFLGGACFKLAIFLNNLFKSFKNNENLNQNNNKLNNDYNNIFKEVMDNNKLKNGNSLNFKNNDYNTDNQSENDNNFLNHIYSKIKSLLDINTNDNQELIFKELKNQFDFNNQNNNQNNDLNNFNNSFENKNFKEKFSINNILNQNIQEIINLKIAIPLIVVVLAIITILSYIFLGFEISLAIILLALIGFFLILYYPQLEKKKKYSEISRELTFALRHMVTELKSGKGLHDTLNSIATHDYGALSEEFARVLEEIKYGENTENSLINMSKRVSSSGLDRTVQQIIGTLRTGGNLSNTLSILAEDITHELQMKLKDYSQKLNAFIMIYTFLAILGPVIFLIMLMAASTVMGDVVPSNVVLILYIFFFPMIVIFMGLMIKRLEPSI